MKNLVLTLAALSLLWSAGSAHAAPTVIDHLPYTITFGGTYVLNSNLNSSQTTGNLITVNASNVTIEFQGHYIAGPVGNTSQMTNGICAEEQSNLTIKNGTIAYCRTGIEIDGNGTATTNSVNHQISNMRLTYCYNYGAYIYKSPATRISNCQVSQIGYSGLSYAYGIAGAGEGITISGNVVSGIIAVNAYGIAATTGAFIRRNTISNATTGVSGGKYQDNLTSNCTTPFSGGTNAGGNN